MTFSIDEKSYHLVQDSIWKGNVAATKSLPIQHETTWPGSVQADLNQFGVNYNLTTPKEKFAPYWQAATIMMVKDEGDIIFHNLSWLYRMGMRRFIVSDNVSTDNTFSELIRFRTLFPESECVVINDPIVRYMQSEKTSAMFHLAGSVWPDLKWIFPIDADEFMVCQQGLRVLDRAPPGVHALTIQKAIHFQRKTEPSLSANIFERMPVRSTLFHLPPKISLINSRNLIITQGNHQAIHTGGDRVIYAGALSLGIFYREFPTRSLAHFLRKVQNGGRAIRAAEHYMGKSVGGDHWLQWDNLLQSRGELALVDVYQNALRRDAVDGFIEDIFPGPECD